MGTWLGDGNDPRYTPTTCFETFPLPWPPGQEPTADRRVQAIADAAKELDASAPTGSTRPSAPKPS